MTTEYSTRGLPDYEETLKGVSAATKEKFYRGLLDGRTVTGQRGEDIAIPGLEEQLLEAMADYRSYLNLVELRQISVAAMSDTDPNKQTGEAEVLEMAYILSQKADKSTAVRAEVDRLHGFLADLQAAGNR